MATGTTVAPACQLPLHWMSAAVVHRQVGSKVDARDVNIGAWFEAVVTKVTTKEVADDSDDSGVAAQMVYSVKYDE